MILFRILPFSSVHTSLQNLAAVVPMVGVTRVAIVAVTISPVTVVAMAVTVLPVAVVSVARASVVITIVLGMLIPIPASTAPSKAFSFALGKSTLGLAVQLEGVWTTFRDSVDALSVEDPANPSGNDLSDLLNAGVRAQLAAVAARALTLIEASGWEAVLGPVEEASKIDRQEGLRRAAVSVTTPTKPWCPDA